MPILTLKPGHVQPVWAGHPWVFQQAVLRVEGGATAGDEVRVEDPRGHFLGRGYYSPRSAIAARILVRDESTPLDAAFFRARIRSAMERRQAFGLPSRETTGLRLVHAEGDGLPGLIVDRFGETLVVQFSTIGMKRRESMLLDVLTELCAPKAIIDRSSGEWAKAEGLTVGSGVIRGDTALSSLAFSERGIQYELPFSLTQKTGFYFDQRPLRGRIEQLARGRRVLDAFSYVGAFGLGAARGGAAHVTCVDESALALEVGAECARRNGVIDRIQYVRADARRYMTEVGQQGGVDLVVVDPPKLAPTKGARGHALVAYQKIAAAACRATRPGGLLAVCSCSAAVGIEALTRALALGAREANARATVLERFFQGIDHPVPAAFPEGLYLKSVLAMVEPA